MKIETWNLILAAIAAIAGPLVAFLISKRKAAGTEFEAIIKARRELSAEYKKELDDSKKRIADLEVAERECISRSEKLESENTLMRGRLDRLEALLDPEKQEWMTGMVARLMWSCPIGFTVVGPDGHLWKVNSEFCDITGYTKAELEGGMTFQEITVEEDLPGDLAMIEKLKAKEETSYTQEKSYNRKTRSPFYPEGIANVLIFVQPIFSVNGDFVAFLSFIRPVSDQTHNWRESPKKASDPSLIDFQTDLDEGLGVE